MTRIALSMSEQLRELLFDPEQLTRLHDLGDVTVVPPADVVGVGAEILVTSWETPDLPDQLPGTRMIAHTGGSIRRIVPPALIESGVVVSQASSEMVLPVAEFALAITLALARHLPTHDRAVIAGGGWPVDDEHAYGRSLAGLRVGVVGAGRVGREYVRMLRALGVAEVTVADPYLDSDWAQRIGVRGVGLDELFSSSDVVAIHAPLTAGTRGMIGADLLSRLPDGAIVVNTARAGILDEDALVGEAVSGRLRFGLDVFHEEPLPAGHPLRGLTNVLLTPHVAGATRDARFAQGRFAVEEVRRFLVGEPLLAAVTAEDYDRIA